MPREGFLTSRTFPARIGIHSENVPTCSTQKPKSHPEAIFLNHTAASTLCGEPAVKYSFSKLDSAVGTSKNDGKVQPITFGVQGLRARKDPRLSQFPPSLFSHLVPSSLTCTVPSLVEHKASGEARTERCSCKHTPSF